MMTEMNPETSEIVQMLHLRHRADELGLAVPRLKDRFSTDYGQLQQDVAAAENGGKLPAGTYAASEKQKEMFKQDFVIFEDIRTPKVFMAKAEAAWRARPLTEQERFKLNRRIQSDRRGMMGLVIDDLKENIRLLGTDAGSSFARNNLSVTDRFRVLGGPEIMALARRFEMPAFRYVYSDHSIAPDGSVAYA